MNPYGISTYLNEYRNEQLKVAKLLKEKRYLIKKLREVTKTGRMYDAVETAKEALIKITGKL